MEAKVQSGVSDISKLPQQLLAQVLSHVSTAHRIRNCSLVSVAWRNAAALATSTITMETQTYGLSQKRKSLSTWLQQHAATAPLDSITVGQPNTGYPMQLRLPTDQLKLLRKLVLAQVEVASWAAESSQASTPVLPSALSAITHLELHDCPMQLSPALRAFSQLQHLTLRLGSFAGQDSDLREAAAALPTMQRLTQLALSHGFACDAVLAGVRHLPSLQVLLLRSSRCTEPSYAVLPATLTQLQVSGNNLLLSPGGTPGLTQLTALQWLEVTAAQLDPAVLNSMQGLQHLALTLDRLQLAPDQPKLAALAGLTDLQHLQLCTKEPLGLESPADIGALTASTHLTFLDVSGGVVAGEHYQLLFPAGRQLPHLRSLHASMGLVSDHASANALVDCCPNVETLDLSGTSLEDPEWDELYGDWPCQYPVLLLGCLTGLRTLVLNGDDHTCDVKTWQSLGHLKSLERLDVKHGVSWGGFSSVAALAACKQLTTVFMTVGEDNFSVKSTAPDGSPPDVWQRLPGEALQMVLQHYHEVDLLNHDAHEALVSLARSAAGHTAEVQAKQQQEHRQLLQELADLRKQQQEQQLELTVLRKQQQKHQQLQAEQQRQRQELDELRAALAAIRPQLRAN